MRRDQHVVCAAAARSRLRLTTMTAASLVAVNVLTSAVVAVISNWWALYYVHRESGIGMFLQPDWYVVTTRNDVSLRSLSVNSQLHKS